VNRNRFPKCCKITGISGHGAAKRFHLPQWTGYGKHLLEYSVYVTQEGQVTACPFTYDMSMLAAQLGNKDELTYFVYLSKYQKKNLKLYLSV